MPVNAVNAVNAMPSPAVSCFRPPGTASPRQASSKRFWNRKGSLQALGFIRPGIPLALAPVHESIQCTADLIHLNLGLAIHFCAQCERALPWLLSP
jgi:hypothetical protein